MDPHPKTIQAIIGISRASRYSVGARLSRDLWGLHSLWSLRHSSILSQASSGEKDGFMLRN
jgi:hypothetical protein